MRELKCVLALIAMFLAMLNIINHANPTISVYWTLVMIYWLSNTFS